MEMVLSFCEEHPKVSMLGFLFLLSSSKYLFKAASGIIIFAIRAIRDVLLYRMEARILSQTIKKDYAFGKMADMAYCKEDTNAERVRLPSDQDKENSKIIDFDKISARK